MFPDENQQKPGLTRAAKWVLGLSCLNVTVLFILSYLIHGVSETSWIGILLTYAPRMPYIVPSLMLIVASLCWHRESLGINIVAAAIAAVPIMGFVVPWEPMMRGSAKLERSATLKIVSCNVQEFKPNFRKVLNEISAINPDVVALQEALAEDPDLAQHFREWHHLHVGNFWVGSKYPMKLLSQCEVTQFEGRLAGVVIELETPKGPVALADIHLMTARRGLTEISRQSLLNGDGTQELEAHEGERYLEAIDLRAAVDAACGDRPLIVCGDFNTPVSSNLFYKHWGDLQSSFDVAGFGLGYTSPCKGNKIWPHNFPWARIDHILCSKDFTVHRCQIGTSDGSDHRLIAATIQLSRNPSGQ